MLHKAMQFKVGDYLSYRPYKEIGARHPVYKVIMVDTSSSTYYLTTKDKLMGGYSFIHYSFNIVDNYFYKLTDAEVILFEDI